MSIEYFASDFIEFSHIVYLLKWDLTDIQSRNFLKLSLERIYEFVELSGVCVKIMYEYNIIFRYAY